MGKQIEEMKNLLMIGGLPCLACLISFIIAYRCYPDDGEQGMILVGYTALIVSVIVILILCRRIWKKIKELP